MGVYYWSQGQYKQAIQLASTALPYFDTLNDQSGLASAYSTIGLNLRSLGDFSQGNITLLQKPAGKRKSGRYGLRRQDV